MMPISPSTELGTMASVEMSLETLGPIKSTRPVLVMGCHISFQQALLPALQCIQPDLLEAHLLLILTSTTSSVLIPHSTLSSQSSCNNSPTVTSPFSSLSDTPFPFIGSWCNDLGLILLLSISHDAKCRHGYLFHTSE